MFNHCLGCMEQYSEEFSVCPHCGYVDGTEVEEAVHMEPGTKLADRYIIGKVLGYGGFGVTYIAWDEKLEQKVAIKEYLPSEFSTRMPGDPTVTVFSGDRSEQFTEGLDKFIEEAKRLSKFQNEAGIVKVFDSFKSNNTAYIVMEYLDGETLTAYMEREGIIPEDKAVEMLAPLMISLQAVHEAGILHRDIAPDNIFLTKSGEVKLIDFGASRYATTSHSRSLTVIIKPGYSPEEQYRSRGDQGPHTDVYALASVMYKMITGITPPDALERRALIETKKKELLKDIHKTNKTIEPNIENAILNAMNVQIEDRTPDIVSFMGELNSTTPVKRRYGKIKKIDVYAWPLWIKIVVPAVVVACLVTGALLVTGVIDFPSLFSGEVKVPEGMVVVSDVEGMDKDKALEEITKLGLIPSPEGNISSAYVEADKIILQTPQGGSYLEKNGKVVLTVSSGAGVVGAVNGISTVPYIVWDTQELAINKLREAGLGEPIIEKEYDDNVAEGKVISQSLTVGTEVPEGTVITIKVSLGAKPFGMPSVKGKTKSEAEKILQAKGLVVRFEYVNDDSVTEDTVMDQDVPTDTVVKRGNVVTLTVSTKKDIVKIANVVGKSKSDAVSTLKGQGFTIIVLENYDETVEKDKVISQNPEGNTGQIKGANITLVVSKGPPIVTVPNVVGKTEQQAKTALIDAKLNVSMVYEKETTVPAGQVISQDPAGNSQQPKGTTITICVSTKEPLINVPNVVGKTKDQAISTLQSVGFAVTTTTEFNDTVPAGSVIRQTPAADTSQKNGSTINICVSAGVEKVSVPSVVGQTETNATSALKSVGFTVTISTEFSSSVPKGNVISQTPVGGTSQTKGSNVNICVSVGEEKTTVPNVVGQTEANATSTLQSSGLTVITSKEFSDTVPNGSVISQTPASGTKVSKATQITIVVSLGKQTGTDESLFTFSSGRITGFREDYEGAVVIPQTIRGTPVTTIGDNAFSSCKKITSVVIPEGVTTIEWGAFRWCDALEKIVLPNSLKTIGDSAFLWCESLKEVKLPPNLISIGEGAFSVCNSLKEIDIPDSVTTIGCEAFDNSLQRITIGKGVKNYGVKYDGGSGRIIFMPSRSLEVIIDSENPYLNMSGNCVIETATKTLLEGFYNCVIPDDGTVTKIRKDAFTMMYWYDYDGPLWPLKIPEGITQIGESAFESSEGLMITSIPSTLTNISYRAFYSASFQNNTLVIPSGVKTIGGYAFYVSNLTSVTIPDSVTSIGDDAFDDYYLKTVYFESEAQKEKFKHLFGSKVQLVVQ